jgi:hypothetical protein
MALLDQQCANRVATGAAVGGALGGAIGMWFSVGTKGVVVL